MEQVRTIEGEIDELMERISSSGDAVVELHLIVGGSKEKCIAYAEKAEALQNLQKKMQGLAQNNGCKHIRELGVRVEVTGLVKNQSASKDLIVTAVKIAK